MSVPRSGKGTLMWPKIDVRMPREWNEAVRAYAERTGIAASEVVRVALEEFFEAHEDEPEFRVLRQP